MKSFHFWKYDLFMISILILWDTQNFSNTIFDWIQIQTTITEYKQELLQSKRLLFSLSPDDIVVALTTDYWVELLTVEILQDWGSLRWALLLMNRFIYLTDMRISIANSSFIVTRIQTCPLIYSWLSISPEISPSSTFIRTTPAKKRGGVGGL